MATRSSIKIIIKDEQEVINTIVLYKHWDWYPQETLRGIVEAIMEYNTRWDRDILACLYWRFCKKGSMDALKLSTLEKFGNMWEEYTYTIEVGTMQHTNDYRHKIKIIVDHFDDTETVIILWNWQWNQMTIIEWFDEYNRAIREDEDEWCLPY